MQLSVPVLDDFKDHGCRELQLVATSLLRYATPLHQEGVWAVEEAGTPMPSTLLVVQATRRMQHLQRSRLGPEPPKLGVTSSTAMPTPNNKKDGSPEEQEQRVPQRVCTHTQVAGLARLLIRTASACPYEFCSIRMTSNPYCICITSAPRSPIAAKSSLEALGWLHCMFKHAKLQQLTSTSYAVLHASSVHNGHAHDVAFVLGSCDHCDICFDDHVVSMAIKVQSRNFMAWSWYGVIMVRRVL
eukprot:1160008-Pelagomonas_calceolata.AAC.6